MQNRRPLVFQCPATNLAVIAPAVADPTLAAQSLTLPYALACPCGQQHVFSVAQGYWWRRKRTDGAGDGPSALRAGAADGA